MKVHEGLGYQATWFASFVAEGRIESPVHGHDDRLSDGTIDEARRQIAEAAETLPPSAEP